MKDKDLFDEINSSSKNSISNDSLSMIEDSNIITESSEDIIQEKLTIEKFKEYLGILGEKGNNFLIERLYQCILRKRTIKVYPNSLCPNDIKHYFKKLNNFQIDYEIPYLFFDITNKGYVTKNDFIKVIKNIYLFICEIKNLENIISDYEIGNFYDYLLSYNNEFNSLVLRKTKFIFLLSNGIINLLDIINKKNIKNQYIISSDDFEEINNISLSIQKFKKIILQKENIESDLSLFTEKYFSKIENQNNKNIYISTFNNEETNNSEIKKTLMSFLPQEKKILLDDIDEMSFSSEEKEDNNLSSNESEIRDKVNDIDYINTQTLENIKKNKINANFESILDKNKGKKFFFLKPFISDNKELNDDLKNNNIDIEKCLILIDKTDFISYVENINNSLQKLKTDILSHNRHFDIEEKSYSLTHFAKPLKSKNIYLNEFIHSFNHFNLEFTFYIYQCLQKVFESSKMFDREDENKIIYKIINIDYKEINQFKFYAFSFCKGFKEIIFQEYSPKIFYNIRYTFKLNLLNTFNIENLIMNLIIGNISNLSNSIIINSKKKDEFVIFSQNNKYIIKSISEKEFEFLLLILPKYYSHIINYKNIILIELFFGVYSISIPSLNLKSYFIIEKNIFYSQNKINITKIYNLKGCTSRKLTSDLLNDNDFIEKKETINIKLNDKLNIIESLDDDAKFLYENNISNYSFFIGIGKNSNFKKLKEEYGFLSNNEKLIYYFGIIDILTPYKGKKKMEHLIKAFTQSGEASVKPPLEYKERFLKFLKTIFK